MRFVFISDTHVGANPVGFQQQKAFPEKLHEILGVLNQWIIEQKDIEFVLHGGDMVDAGTTENIQLARKLFKLSVPVYLCLGNHDLNRPHAVERWFTHAPEFFPSGAPTYFLKKGPVCIHVIPTQWDQTPYNWSDIQNPHFLLEQLTEVKNNQPIGEEIHFLCTHSCVLGVPAVQTGFPHEFHHSGEAFEHEVFEIIRHNSAIRCVLSGHNHINTNVTKDSIHFVTASSFSEIPFEAKVFDVSETSIAMETLTLLPNLALLPHFQVDGAYDFNKTFVQGREKDRSFHF